MYKPMRFFYIYFCIYIINILPKNKDLGFEDTFFFRGYKLYFLKNSDLLRRYLFEKGSLKIVTPEGYFWKNKKWNLKENDFQSLNSVQKFFLNEVASKRNVTDISLFFNIWSKTKKGKFWFLNQNLTVNFPKINEFSFGTEFFRVFKYKTWKHSYINRLLYQSSYSKPLVAQRMLDYSFNFNENAFVSKNSFSYFFNFDKSYLFLPYKGDDKHLKVKGWTYSEKFFLNRASQYPADLKDQLRKSMQTYYAKVSKIQLYFPYTDDYERSGNFAKTVDNLYSSKSNFFSRTHFRQIKNIVKDGYYDVLVAKNRIALSKFLNKISREYFLEGQTYSQQKIQNVEDIKNVWSLDRAFSFGLHKKLSGEKNFGNWDSYFIQNIFNTPFKTENDESLGIVDNKILKNSSNAQFMSVKDFIYKKNFKYGVKKKMSAFELKKLDIFNLENYTKTKKKFKNSYYSYNTINPNDIYELKKKPNLTSFKNSSLVQWNDFLGKNNLHVHSKVLKKINLKNHSPFINKELKNLKKNIKSQINILGIGENRGVSPSKKNLVDRKRFYKHNAINDLGIYLVNLSPFSYQARNTLNEVDFLGEYDNYNFVDLFQTTVDFVNKNDINIAKRIKAKNDLEDFNVGGGGMIRITPNVGRLYNFVTPDQSPLNYDRVLFNNNLLHNFTFVLDPKYLHYDYYYQVYPALFNDSNVDTINTLEYSFNRPPIKDESEEDYEQSPAMFSMIDAFELQLEKMFHFEDMHLKVKSAKNKHFPYIYSKVETQDMIYRPLEKDPYHAMLDSTIKKKFSQDFDLPEYNFYQDSIRYSNILSLDFLKKSFNEEQILRKNSFFSSSQISKDISNFRMNHLYSKIFFEKNFRERNFFNSKTDRSFFKKEKLNVLTFPSGKLKSPTKYDYYFVNKVGNRGYIDYKISSKFLNENPFVNSLKLKESKFLSFLWNELPSNFIFVEFKYLLIDFFYSKVTFLNSNICFTITRILLSLSDRLLYEFISAIKIYVISWFSVLVDDVVGLYMRYYLIMLDHNTLLFVSRKNVAYGSYTIVKTRDRSFENRRLFGLRDMRRRFYKGVGLPSLRHGSEMNEYDFNTDIYKFNTTRKKYTKIRGSNYGFYDKFLTQRRRAQSRKSRKMTTALRGDVKKNINRDYKKNSSKTTKKMKHAMMFSNTSKGSEYFNRKSHAHPQNYNKQGFIILSRSKVTFKPGRSFQFGKFYMKFRFRPLMLRFSNSTYFFRYKNLSSSLFTEYNRFPKIRRKFFDFFKYSDLSFKSKSRSRNIKILPAKTLRTRLKDSYKNKMYFFKFFKYTADELKYYKDKRNIHNTSLFYESKTGFDTDLDKHFSVTSSYGVNEFLMRYSISFKFLNNKNNVHLYDNDYYINKNFFDNFFLYDIPVNYKLRFIKLTDMMMIDFMKWKKYYVEGHTAWIGENARVYNLDFYKNSNIRNYKRRLKYKSRKKMKIREIPYKVNQRYSFSLYKNPFLKNKDSDFIKSLFFNKKPQELPYTRVVFNNILSETKKNFKRINFKSSKYLKYYINNLRKRKSSYPKIYFRTYNRTFYDYMRNFKTKKKPAYRVPLNYSYFNRKTLFFKKRKSFLLKRSIRKVFSFIRKIGAWEDYKQFNHMIVRQLISPVVSPIVVKSNRLFVNIKLNLMFLFNKFNLNFFYNNDKKKDYDFSFFDIKEKFRDNFIAKVKTMKKTKREKSYSSRRVVTFWNRNYFLKFRKIGYNNLIYRRSYNVRNNVIKIRKWKSKFRKLNYFILNPRFWNSKAYDAILTGFYAGFLNKKGHRSHIKHYQIADLLRKRKNWVVWKYKSNIKYSYKQEDTNEEGEKTFFKNLLYKSKANLKYNERILKILKKQDIHYKSEIKKNKNILNFSKIDRKNKNIFIYKKAISKKNTEFDFSLGSYLLKKKFLNKAFMKNVILNYKKKSNIFKFSYVPNDYLKFIKINTSRLPSISFGLFKSKIYFSFFFKKNFSNFCKNFKNSFISSNFRKNFSLKKKAFLNIYDHLSSYKFTINYIIPTSYRYYLRKNKYYTISKNRIQEKKFFYMSKFFFKYLNIYMDFIDFAARLQRESFFHKKFRKNLHTKFFMFRFFNRKFSNYVLVDKNFNYLNLIFNRVFTKNNYQKFFNNEFINFFLKYKRYRYNKHQYSRFRRPKYYSLLSNNYKYFDFLKEKKLFLEKSKNYSTRKKAAISKKLSKTYNSFLHKIWNVVSYRKNKRLYKQETLENFNELYRYSTHDVLELLINGKIKKQIVTKMLNPNTYTYKDLYNNVKNIFNVAEHNTYLFRRKDLFAAKFMKHLKNKDTANLKNKRKFLKYLELCQEKRNLINEKFRLSEKNLNLKYSNQIKEVDNKINKIHKKIIKDFYGLSLGHKTLARSEELSSNRGNPIKGRFAILSGRGRAKKKKLNLFYYNKGGNSSEIKKKKIKSAKNPKYVRRKYFPKQSLKNNYDNEFTRDSLGFYSRNNIEIATGDRDLFKNYNKRVNPFVWRNRRKASSKYNKRAIGFNQFFRRTYFNRRYNKHISIKTTFEKKIREKTKLKLYATESSGNRKRSSQLKEWEHFRKIMKKKKLKADSYISSAYPKTTTKHKLWSKSRFKKQKIFILNFPKSKKYSGFSYLYNSRFAYVRGQKNYYRDRSLQNVVFDQNFKAQKFFEVIKSRRLRKKKRRHMKYNRARNIRSAIFESRLKTRFWLRNKYFSRLKKKPAIFLDIKIPGKYTNSTRIGRIKVPPYKDINYTEIRTERRRFDEKKGKKINKDFSFINKIKKISNFSYLKNKKHTFGNSYRASILFSNINRKGFSYAKPYVYKVFDDYTAEEPKKSDIFSRRINRSILKIQTIRNSSVADYYNILKFDLLKPDPKFDILRDEKFESANNLQQLAREEIYNPSDEILKFDFLTKKTGTIRKGSEILIDKDKPTVFNKNILYINRFFEEKIIEYRKHFSLRKKHLKRRSRFKKRRYFSYRSNLGIRKKSMLLSYFYKRSAINNLYFFPSLKFKNKIKTSKNLNFLNLNKNILDFFEKHSKISKIKNNSLLFFLKYKSFALDFVSTKEKKVKLAWYFLKNYQTTELLNRTLTSRIETEKFGNFYIVDNQFTYGKKLNNYISYKKLYNIDFDLLYDSRRFKKRYYRRRIPFKTIVSAKSHLRTYKKYSEFDKKYTEPAQYLTYMFNYPNSKKPTIDFINDLHLNSLKRFVYFKNLNTLTSSLTKDENFEYKNDEISKKYDLYKKKKDIERAEGNIETIKERKIEEMTAGLGTLRTGPRLAMNYKREHFKHYYFYTSKRQKYGFRFISRLSKACIVRIDVLLFLHVLRGIFYYSYRIFILYLHSLKIFMLFAVFLIFYKIFVFFWIKNVLPNLISLRNIYFLSNKLVERRFINDFSDFYRQKKYDNFFLKKKSRIFKTELFSKKNYFDRYNKELSFFHENDKYFVRNFFFKYSNNYKKIFITMWIKGFFSTIKDTFLTGFFLFFYFIYKLLIFLFNFLLNFIFKYIIGEIILCFLHFVNLLFKRSSYYHVKKKSIFYFLWNILFSFVSFLFVKIISIFFLFFKILIYFFIFIMYSLFIFNYLKYYNLTLTELPSTVIVLFLHAFLVFSFASISKNIKNLLVESNLNNIFPESIFSIGKEDDESTLSVFFEMEHTYFPENHFIDYDKLMYSITMDKVLAASGEQNPSNHYLGSHLSSNYRETSLSVFGSRYNVNLFKVILKALNPLKKSFRDEDVSPSMNFIVNRNYIIPNEISQKITDSNPIKNFFYKSTIIPNLDINRLHNVFNEKSSFLNFKQIYTLKFKFLTDYREFHRTKKKKKDNIKDKLPNYLKNYWIQRVKLKRKENSNKSTQIHYKLYENKIYKINNFNFFTYKNYKVTSKIVNPYKKYLVLLFLLQFREYNRIQQIYNEYIKDIYYPFAYQDGILWDDLFDNFEFSNRSIWPSSDFGLFFQKKFREEINLKNKINFDLESEENKNVSNLIFLMKNREHRPDYRSIYKRYKNSWFLDYDKTEYIKDIDKFEESIKVFTSKQLNRMIAIFEEDEDETQSMLEEHHYLMDETDLSVYYDDHIFTMEDTSLFDYESLSIYNEFINKLNFDFLSLKKINYIFRKKAFEKVFLEEYRNNKKFYKKINFKNENQYKKEKILFKKNKNKLAKKVLKEYIFLKKNYKYNLYLKKFFSSNYKYKFNVASNVLKNISREESYKSNLNFGIESGSFLYRGSFFDPRVSPRRIHNILKNANDIEFQDNNWFKNLVEKRTLVDTSFSNENYLFKNNISMSDIDSVLFCDVINKESALGRLSDYGAPYYWDDHVWITASSEFRNAVTEFLLNMEKKYKVQYDLGIFNKTINNNPVTLYSKKHTMDNNKKKVSRLQYYKKDPLDTVLSKKFTEDRVHSLDFENYRHRGQFLDFPSDFEALNKQVSFVPITQIVSINDIKISNFKVWFKEILWYQIFDNRYKRAFFEDFLNICEFLDLRHFPVLNLEESERLWCYLGCTEEEWDFVETEPTNITVPFGSDEIIFFFLLAYVINTVPTTVSVGHPRTLYALEDSSKIIIYYRNITFHKIYSFFMDFFRLFVMSIHWSKDFLDFLNLYKYPVERTTGTYSTYPYIPYNKFFNPFKKYWFNPQVLDFESTWSFQTYYANSNRNIYSQNVALKELYKLKWIDLEDEYVKDFYNLENEYEEDFYDLENEYEEDFYDLKDESNLVLKSKYNLFEDNNVSLPLHRLGPVRNFAMNRKKSIFYSNNSSEIGWNDRGFGMDYFGRYNSLANLPQNCYFKNFKLNTEIKNILKKNSNKIGLPNIRKPIRYNIYENFSKNFKSSFLNTIKYIDIATKKFFEHGTGMQYPETYKPLYNFSFEIIKPLFYNSYSKFLKSTIYLKKFTDFFISEKISHFNVILNYTYLDKLYSYMYLYLKNFETKKVYYFITKLPSSKYAYYLNYKNSTKYLKKKFTNYFDFFLLKTNSRKYSLLDGFNSDFFLSKKISLVREKKSGIRYNFFGSINFNLTNISTKMSRSMRKWRKRYRKNPNKFFNFITTPTYKKYTIANYYPEPLLHTPSLNLSSFRSRILFNYDWFYIKCIITLFLSIYFILSIFFSPFFFILTNIFHFLFSKILWYLSFVLSDIFIINLYNFVCFILVTFKTNYLILLKLYLLLIFDFFYYIFDLSFLKYLLKFLLFTNILEILNLEYWISILQFLNYCIRTVIIDLFYLNFFSNFICYTQKCYFFFEHFFFNNINYSFVFSNLFKNDIEIFFIISSIFYYPYYIFPHLYISFVHSFMVFFHVFVNFFFVEYFSVYILFIDIKPYFFLVFDYFLDYFFFKNTLLSFIYFLSYFIIQILLYFILIISFTFFYIFYFIHMFFQFLALFYVIYFFFT